MCFHIKERLEGYDFFTITQVHQRALAVESRSKESQESHRHHRSSVHALECNSNCSDDESNDVYAAIRDHRQDIKSNRVKMLIAAKRMRRARSKIQNIYSRGGVPQACLILRSEGCNVCAQTMAETSCFNINLSKIWPTIVYRPWHKKWPM